VLSDTNGLIVCRPQLLQVLIGLFELPQDTTAVTDDIPLVDPDADNAGMMHIFCSCSLVNLLLLHNRLVGIVDLILSK